jgi:LDH2 family malate/lactate/ureidoglycolate dehydrogenase
LGVYALKAADAGALCLIGQRTPPALALAGFSGPAIGDNSIAFSCPNPNSHPIVFDVACSVVAGGKIRIAAQEGESIPKGWALDRAGKSTTNAKRALEGALLPFGGHKGIGIAMMVECLAGAVAASASSLYAPDRHVIPEDGAPGRQSAFLFMIKPDAFTLRKHFVEYVKQWTDYYLRVGVGTLDSRGNALPTLNVKRG